MGGARADRVVLYGREIEMAEIGRLLAGVRAGHGGVLVIRGGVGAGKSALLDHAASGAGDARLLRSGGIEPESELPFAGVHQLTRPVLDRLDALPPVQAGALRGALGLGDTVVADRFLIGLAILSLLAGVAADTTMWSWPLTRGAARHKRSRRQAERTRT